MKVIIDRDLCNTSLQFCQRCSATFFRFPEGSDRLCIMDVIDDGKESLSLEMKTDGRILEIELTDEDFPKFPDDAPDALSSVAQAAKGWEKHLKRIKGKN